MSLGSFNDWMDFFNESNDKNDITFILTGQIKTIPFI